MRFQNRAIIREYDRMVIHRIGLLYVYVGDLQRKYGPRLVGDVNKLVFHLVTSNLGDLTISEDQGPTGRA